MSNRIQSLALVVLGVPVMALALAATANGDTIHVCWDGSGDYLTIQEGIDAAGPGDEVVVCDGTYTGPLNKNLDFAGKLITVRSEHGPENCVIDCEGYGGGFYFLSGEGAEAVVDGFTITNGDGGGGGGVHCWWDSNPTITNCTITGNTAGYGGGVYCEGSSPTITNCTISGNSASHSGGGVFCEASYPAITNCTITGNTAYSGGGGVGCFLSLGLTITNCTISGNTSYSSGGGVDCSESDPTITNSILWGDSASNGPEIALRDGSTLTVSYCDVEGGEPSAYVDETSTLYWGAGNLDADPLFVPGPVGYYYLSQTAAGQPADSPCVDAGSDTAENLGLDTRTTRTDQVPDSGIVDMGYHYPIVCPGDIDGDGDTDHSDLGELLAGWCTHDGDPNWNPNADLDGDGHVGHGDLGILLADWGCDINP